MRRLTASLLAMVFLAFVIFPAAAAHGGAPAAPAPAAPGTAVLDLASGSFRTYVRWKTPVLADKDGKLAPMLPVAAGALPAEGWSAPGFDDGRWPRARGAVVGYHREGVCARDVEGWGSPPSLIYAWGSATEWGLVCLRGAFRVSDPAQVKDLRLTLRYCGGAVVLVNGAELARGHLPEGQLGPETLAERYPEEAYVTPDGKLYDGNAHKAFAERIKVRDRELAVKGAAGGVAIPATMLRKGVNVIAIEVRTAPVDVRAVKGWPGGNAWPGKFLPWAHAGVLDARVTAGSAAGLAPSVGPAEGLAMHGCPVVESVTVRDYAHPCDAPTPLRLIGARNGSFSAKAVLSSAAAIRKPRATVTDLAQDGGSGVIPAKAVQVRWAEPAAPAVSWVPGERFDRLLAEPPAEYAAAAPVWVTVHVPADAAAGKYRGTLTVTAEGAAPAKITVPVEVQVHDWKLPAPGDFASRHNIYQSPDSVARYYKVPLWSDKHFELMGRSFEVLNQVASRICAVDLIIGTPTLNNTESMVRWVKKPGSPADKPEYTYDFTIAEKYMDLYEKVCGKPAILLLNVWGNAGRDPKNPPPSLPVSLLDPATGKIEPLVPPPYGTAENEAFWKPVLTELRQRLEKRKWFDVTAVCYTSYCWMPPKAMVDVYQHIWPDGKWMNCSHENPASYPGTAGSMPVPFNEWVWNCGDPYNPDRIHPNPHLRAEYLKFPRPWRQGGIALGNPRYGVGFIEVLNDSSPLSAYRMVAEGAMQSNVRGLGRVGGDFWPLSAGKGGRLVPLCDGYCAVGPTNNVVAMLSPGPEGAIFNERLEMFREGVQACEAIIFVQKALEAKKVDGELAKKIDTLLDERARYYLRTRLAEPICWLSFECSDWQGRDGRLFALAAEVVKITGDK